MPGQADLVADHRRLDAGRATSVWACANRPSPDVSHAAARPQPTSPSPRRTQLSAPGGVGQEVDERPGVGDLDGPRDERRRGAAGSAARQRLGGHSGQA